MPVRSTQLGAGQITTDGTVITLYTVPADRTAILKDVRFRLQGTGAVYLQARCNGVGVAVAKWTPAASDEALTLPSYPPWIVLLEGDSLEVYHGPSGVLLDYVMSGALLDGDPA